MSMDSGFFTMFSFVQVSYLRTLKEESKKKTVYSRNTNARSELSIARLPSRLLLLLLLFKEKNKSSLLRFGVVLGAVITFCVLDDAKIANNMFNWKCHSHFKLLSLSTVSKAILWEKDKIFNLRSIHFGVEIVWIRQDFDVESESGFSFCNYILKELC